MATARLNHAAPPQPLGAACKRPRRLPRPPAALQADAGGPPQERVAALVWQQGGGAALYATGAPGEALAAAVADLVATNASQRPAPDSLTAGQGTWEVFHAPHIARLSSVLGARFQPIRYTLRGNELISNVHYEHPLLGAGWLSASGTLEAADDATLVINFKRFWWDLGPLRAELPSSSSGSQGSSSGSQGSGGNALLDSIVGALGRASFLPQFARFPVQQLDGQAGLAVFRFPPLASSIAVARCSSSPSTSSASGSSADGSLPVA